MINYEDFKKLDLRAAKILAAERVAGSDKLLKLKISLGEEERQLVAGIGQSYGPETLVGKQIIIVANLESKTIMGLESQGMLLAIDPAKPVLVITDKEVPPGSQVC